jgi:HTH-type transcriptional regulator / antitoxin HigA
MTVAVRKLDARKYGRLLLRVLPVVIQTEEEYDRIDAEVGNLLKKGHNKLAPEERALFELLTKLIEDYDAQHYSFPQSQPHERLRALMEHNELTQADLLPIFKSRGYISEVLNGKRAISKRIAKALGERFSVSADLFI